MTETVPVAVVVPARNYGQYLEEALRSLALQTVSPAEVWVVDDASDDDTADVIARMSQELPMLPLHSVRHDEPRGFVAALETGFALSQSPLIAHVDADDRVLPRYLELLWRALEDHPEAGYAYPRVRLFGSEAGIFLSGPFNPARLVYEGNYIPHIGIMRRESYERTKGYRDLPTHVDWDLWLSFLDVGIRGLFVDKVLYEWRRHSQSMTMRPISTRLGARLRVLLGHPGLLVQYLIPGIPYLMRSLWRRARMQVGVGRAPYARTASCWIEPRDAFPRMRDG